MLNLRLRPRARRDLQDIWEYTRERWSVEQADRYLGAIRQQLERLRRTPRIGRPLGDSELPLLKHPSGRHFIFFMVDAAGVDVVRILHQSMDFAAHLPEDKA